jgi:1,4-dihydroxy-2-naphthoyl-CoA hydrolase
MVPPARWPEPRMRLGSLRGVIDKDALLAGAVGFDALLGLELLDVDDEAVTAQMTVRDELLQPFGLVHGGVLASIAETLASVGTAVAVVPEGNAAMGLSNQTSFMRPISSGVIHARATRRHRGRTTWIWDIEISDDAGRLCALTRMTIAVRPQS